MPGAIGASLNAGERVRNQTPAMIAIMATIATVEPMRSIREPPLEPWVLAFARARFASLLARRCCRAERRLVGGAVLPGAFWRPVGRLTVIADSFLGDS
jgi:hypothetical protein